MPGNVAPYGGLCRKKPVVTGFVTSDDPMTTNNLQPTSWLAKRLDLSVSTIERLRTRGEGQLPPHLVTGRHTIRYDVAVVEDWLAARQHGRMSVPPSPLENAEPTAGKTFFASARSVRRPPTFFQSWPIIPKPRICVQECSELTLATSPNRLAPITQEIDCKHSSATRKNQRST